MLELDIEIFSDKRLGRFISGFQESCGSTALNQNGRRLVWPETNFVQNEAIATKESN